jgi:hypothetical protein
MAYASGKKSRSTSDRSGQVFPYQEMVKEWTGALVHISEYEPKHPQLRRRKSVSDAIALQNSRPQDFQLPSLVDGVLASSGGQGMMTADLTLPGQFAFSSNGMMPDDGSFQNRQRELLSFVGSVTIVIS